MQTLQTAPAFISREPWCERRVRAMAIYCSDGRWGDAIDEFCHQGLGVPAYDRFAVPGGAAWLNNLDCSRFYLCEAARQQIDFLVKSHGLERIILITHFGCAFYAHRLGLGPEACLPKQLEELHSAAKTLHRWFDGLRVEAYLATREAGSIVFHGVEAPEKTPGSNLWSPFQMEVSR